MREDDKNYSFIKEHKEKLERESTKQKERGTSSRMWEFMFNSEWQCSDLLDLVKLQTAERNKKKQPAWSSVEGKSPPRPTGPLHSAAPHFTQSQLLFLDKMPDSPPPIKTHEVLVGKSASWSRSVRSSLSLCFLRNHAHNGTNKSRSCWFTLDRWRVSLSCQWHFNSFLQHQQSNWNQTYWKNKLKGTSVR